MGYISRKISVCILGIEFLFVVLFSLIAFGINTHPGQDKYYAAPVPVCHEDLPFSVSETHMLQYWCWIGNGFVKQRYPGEYIWFWLTLGVSLILYIPLFLLYLGVIQRGTRWYMPKASTDGLSTHRHGPYRGDSQDGSHGAGGLSASQGSIAGMSTEVQGVVSPSQENSKLLSTILYVSPPCCV